MNSFRMIASIQISKGNAVKTRGFRDELYVGSPSNAAHIYSALGADSIHIIDLDAARQSRLPDMSTLAAVSQSSRVPLSYSGGLVTREAVAQVFAAGFEKVYFGRAIFYFPELVAWAVNLYGAQAVGAVLDVSPSGDDYILLHRTEIDSRGETLEAGLRKASALGVGEVLLNRWDLEGSYEGLDATLAAKSRAFFSSPILISGGFSSLSEFLTLERVASGAVVGSRLTFSGGPTSVLLNYPTAAEIQRNLEISRVPDKGSVAELSSTSPLISTGTGLSGVECPRCIITSSVPGSEIEGGTCYYCRFHDALNDEYSTDGFLDWVRRIKEKGRSHQKYDCILGVSGGADSSYLLHLLVSAGVRVLAVHFDNGWNTPTATMNIHRMTTRLNIDLETFVADHREYDNLYKAFLCSGVRDIEAPTDIGFMSVLYRSAQRHGVRQIVEGHSFRTEGMSPLGWLYMDGAYVRGVYRSETGMRLKRYPNMGFFKFVYWAVFARLERHRPLYLVDYDKRSAREFLSGEYGWEWYGGHHLENRFTAFFHSYFLPSRYGIDYRQIELSALVRSGFVSRDEAKHQFSLGRAYRVADLLYIQSRLNVGDIKSLVQNAPRRNYSEFPNYKKRFRRLRFFFWILMKLNLVPETFYEKYCASK